MAVRRIFEVLPACNPNFQDAAVVIDTAIYWQLSSEQIFASDVYTHATLKDHSIGMTGLCCHRL